MQEMAVATLFVLVVTLWLEAAQSSRPLLQDNLHSNQTRGCVPLAFVQKTHKLTKRFLESAKLAKEQVERCGGYHRVLYYQSEEAAREAVATSGVSTDGVVDLLAAFRSALGKHSVIVFGSADISVAFGVEWDALKAMAKRDSFMWHRGDAYEITWYELFSADLPAHITHIWFAEYNVGWTGDLHHLLSTSFPPAADFVCSTENKLDGVQINPDWFHFSKRNWLRDSDVRQCLVMLVRYSRRMLATIRAETKMGHFQYSKITGAAICTRHHRWCSMSTFSHWDLIVGRDATSGAALFSWATSISPESWDNITVSAKPGEPGRLYHALKW